MPAIRYVIANFRETIDANAVETIQRNLTLLARLFSEHNDSKELAFNESVKTIEQIFSTKPVT